MNGLLKFCLLVVRSAKHALGTLESKLEDFEPMDLETQQLGQEFKGSFAVGETVSVKFPQRYIVTNPLPYMVPQTREAQAAFMSEALAMYQQQASPDQMNQLQTAILDTIRKPAESTDVDVAQ